MTKDQPVEDQEGNLPALVVRWIGQIAGAAGAAYAAAPHDVRKQAALGAGIGGSIPFVGAPLAALGAYLATKPADGRRRNLGAGATTLLVILGLAAAGGATYAGVQYWKKRQIPANYLSGFIAPGATLSAAPGLVEDVEQEISLTGIQLRDKEGTIHDVAETVNFYPPTAEDPDGSMFTNHRFPADGYEFEGMVALGRVVTNLNGQGAVAIYDQILEAYIAGAQDPGVASVTALQTLLPKIHWGKITPGSAEDMVFYGADILAQIAWQNLPGYEQP
jgi:hypothetical protein